MPTYGLQDPQDQGANVGSYPAGNSAFGQPLNGGPRTNNNQLSYAEDQYNNAGKSAFGNTQYLDQAASKLGSYNTPTAASQNWSYTQGQPTTYTSPGYGAAAFSSLSAANPGSIQGDFNTAWDLAQQKGIGTANQQAAARGNYGSSAALNGVGAVIAQNTADRANAQNQFSLQDSANQLAWQNAIAGQANAAEGQYSQAFNNNLAGLAARGQAASSADNSNLAQLNALTNGYQSLDSAQLNRANAGMNASTLADAAFNNRQSAATAAQLQSLGLTTDQINQFLQYYNGVTDPNGTDTSQVGAATSDLNDENNDLNTTGNLVKGVVGGYAAGKAGK